MLAVEVSPASAPSIAPSPRRATSARTVVDGARQNHIGTLAAPEISVAFRPSDRWAIHFDGRFSCRIQRLPDLSLPRGWRSCPSGAGECAATPCVIASNRIVPLQLPRCRTGRLVDDREIAGRIQSDAIRPPLRRPFFGRDFSCIRVKHVRRDRISRPVSVAARYAA